MAGSGCPSRDKASVWPPRSRSVSLVVLSRVAAARHQPLPASRTPGSPRLTRERSPVRTQPRPSSSDKVSSGRAPTWNAAATARLPRLHGYRSAAGADRAPEGFCSSSIPVAWRWAGRMLATTPKAAVTTNGETRARTGDTAIRSCAAIRDHVCGRPYRRRQPSDVRSGSYRFSRRPHAPLRHRRAHHSRARLPGARRARRSSHPRRLRAGRVNARHSPAPGRRVVGLVFAVRNRSAELDVLPELVVDGLGPADARALLGSAIGGPID